MWFLSETQLLGLLTYGGDPRAVGPSTDWSPTMPLARVQKLEAQMATLLQHVWPWMQNAIEESATRVGQQMEQMMDQLASLQANLDALLTPPETEPESTPTTPVDDMVLDTLIRDEMTPPTSSHHTGKLPHYGRTSNDIEAGRAHKRERQELEVA
uniref:Integrase core domain containing protein n=1 Tax=Solanum tuberosum TaxID=4113 RepID=M1DEE0_SOLTU